MVLGSFHPERFARATHPDEDKLSSKSRSRLRALGNSRLQPFSLPAVGQAQGKSRRLLRLLLRPAQCLGSLHRNAFSRDVAGYLELEVAGRRRTVFRILTRTCPTPARAIYL